MNFTGVYLLSIQMLFLACPIHFHSLPTSPAIDMFENTHKQIQGNDSVLPDVLCFFLPLFLFHWNVNFFAVVLNTSHIFFFNLKYFKRILKYFLLRLLSVLFFKKFYLKRISLFVGLYHIVDISGSQYFKSF